MRPIDSKQFKNTHPLKRKKHYLTLKVEKYACSHTKQKSHERIPIINSGYYGEMKRSKEKGGEGEMREKRFSFTRHYRYMYKKWKRGAQKRKKESCNF